MDLIQARQLFSLRPGAGKKQIDKTFRRLAKKCHPDRFQDLSKEKQSELANKMKELSWAYQLLCADAEREPAREDRG